MERALCPILVGREEPLTALEDALLAAHRGDGQVAVVRAEAGMGKTRLTLELERRAGRAGTLVLRGTCSEADLTLPYLPFLEALGSYLMATDLDRVRNQIGGAAAELARLFPYLAPTAVSSGGDPGQARLRLYESVWTMLRTAAAGHGLLLVIEDVHWADASTLELLDYLARRLRLVPILLVMTYRSDEVSHRDPLFPVIEGWRRTGLALQITLPPLPPEDVAAMVTAICDDQPVGSDFRDFLQLQNEGNPFVIEEFVRAALERGDIYKLPVGWTRRSATNLRLPRTIGDAVLIRVARMSEDDALILRTASILGVAFAYDLLVRVTHESEDRVQAALRTFMRLQLMEEETVPGRYRFRHSLTRDAIYQAILTPERRGLHQRAAAVLRELNTITPAELASHLLAAGLDAEALPVCLKAAEDAERQFAYRQAADLYERVLPHIAHPSLRPSLICRLGNAQYLAGDRRRAPENLAKGIELLEQGGHAAEAATYRLALGRCLWERAQPSDARAHYEKARDMLEPLGPSEELAFAYVRLAGLHDFAFAPARTVATARQAVVVAEAAGSDAARIWATIYLGLGLAGTGRPDEALALLDRSYQEALERGIEWMAGSALSNGISVRLEHLRGREALPLLAQLRALQGWHLREILASFYEGLIRLALGEPIEARRCTEAGIVLARDTEATTFLGWMECTLAMVAAAQGRTEEAGSLLAGLPPRQERQEAVLRLYAAIRVGLAAGDQAGAEREASLLLDQLDWSRPLVAQELQALDQAVEALLATDRLAVVASALSQAGASLRPDEPYTARMHARLALANHELAHAEDLARASAAHFGWAGYRDDEWRSRRLWAVVLARQGRRERANDELQAVLAEALAAGVRAEVRQAAQELRRLGVAVPEEPAPHEPEPARPGERLVTILSVDVRDYTALTERRPPADMADRLATLYRWARREVERQHGLVHEYAGDAIMATFNLSVMRLEHAVDACRAAVAVRDRAEYVGLDVGIGVATGPAIVGELVAGTPLTAIGASANLAARLQEQARAGEILLSDETFRRVESWLQARGVRASREALELKGLSWPAVAHRLAAPVPMGSGLVTGSPGGS